MSKIKAQTLQQRLGFQDHELATPMHDELMLWLDAWVHTGLSTLVSRQYTEICIEKENEYDKTTWDKMHVEEFNLRFGSHEDLAPSVRVDLVRKVWEYPIVNRSYTIGFADMVCVANGEWGELTYNIKKSKLSLDHHHGACFYFEVKPTIVSLGEVIRQIRMYETYTIDSTMHSRRYSRWFIVSPDNRFKAQIESQGIGFIEVK